MQPNGTLSLLIGPVGAGKSSYARSHERAMFLDCDEWMVRLFGDDTRPKEGVLDWYLERRQRCRSLLWDTAVSALRSGTQVFLELGLVTATERSVYYEKAADEDLSLSVLLFDAPREVRRKRVLDRNAAAKLHTQIVPLAFFERASDLWEEPTAQERARWNISDA